MKTFAIIGLGRFGASMAVALAEKGQQVVAIDKEEELVHDVMDVVTRAVCLDATDERAMKAVGLQDVDVAVCAIGTNIEASILVTLLLKEMGVKSLVCKADGDAHKKVLEKIGADRVILPEKDTGIRTADTLMSISEKILDHIGIYGNSSILELVPPEHFLGKSLRELEMRAKHGVNVIAIKEGARTGKSGAKEGEGRVNVTPQADDILRKGDILVVFGENEKIDKLKRSG